jgi:hypothetical protein
MKEFLLYEKRFTRVYINQCHNKGRKTKLFAIRRDDILGKGHFMGQIYFDGAWRQYVSTFEPNTKWSAGCKEKICEFERELNRNLREKWKLKR